MVLNKKSIVAAVFLLVLSAFSSSLFALAVPELKGRVNDYANVMNQREEAEISSYLESLEQTTGIQIAVLTIPSLKGEDIAAYSIKVCDAWQLGRKGKDDGALLLVAYNDHQVRIEVGYGLEDKLTDAKSGLIIRNVIIPEFKAGNYYQGIYKGVKNMGGVASNNAELISHSVQNDDEDLEEALVGIVFMIIWLIFMVFVLFSKASRRFMPNNGFFRWLFLMNMMNSNNHHHHNNFGSSNHFGGGGFGGGFSGGGGHFGGGGASGHW